MIGGTDIIFPTRAGANAMDFALREIRQEWPDSAFEDALTGEIFDDYESVPLGSLSELLVYQDQNIAREWDRRGCEPDLANTMIHLILSNDALTIVVDDPSEKAIERLLSTIGDGLFQLQDIFYNCAFTSRAA